MHILIITTFYPPDTAIAAVRPYMFAKYLAKLGNQVTVIRSGLINKSIGSNFPDLENVRVISYMGENSPAERYKRDMNSEVSTVHNARLSFLPKALRKPVSNTYRCLMRPMNFFMRKRTAKNRLELLKKAIDNLASEHFDVVFSTYSELENAYAGEYAREKLSAKWIMDFRDPIAQGTMQPAWEYKLWKEEQDRIMDSCDLCTRVSDDLCVDTDGKYTEKTITLYNGYDDETKQTGISCLEEEHYNDKLILCYTGQLYGQRSAAMAELIKAIKVLSDSGRIEISKIELKYAGNGADEIQQMLIEHQLDGFFTDCGYLTRDEVEKLQQTSDLFLVLSWNTKKEQGVLTGKFYEGIKARMPILALVMGDLPHSELFQLNEKYHYGFCYEACQGKDHFEELCNYLEELYLSKHKGASLYNPDPELFNRFRYSVLAAQLQDECIRLIGEEGVTEAL